MHRRCHQEEPEKPASFIDSVKSGTNEKSRYATKLTALRQRSLNGYSGLLGVRKSKREVQFVRLWARRLAAPL
jgi:hypothetical protein